MSAAAPSTQDRSDESFKDRIGVLIAAAAVLAAIIAFLQTDAAAVADYRAAQAAGRQDAAVAWNLGWNEYLLGHLDAAIRADGQALELDATLFPVRLNLGLALLASGQVEAAQKEYALAMAQAGAEVTAALAGGQQVPVSSWYYLDGRFAFLQPAVIQ